MKKIYQIIFIFSLFINCLSHATLPDLHQAVKDGNLEQVQALLDAGADVNATAARWPNDDSTPLHLAAFWGHKAIVNLLLDKGANVNAIIKMWSYNEVTPLHLAAINGYTAIVKLLLDKGANVNAGAASDQTPLHVTENNTEAAKLLECWPKYQELLKKRRREMLTFLMASHPRLGSNSPTNVLYTDLFKHIWNFVKPTKTYN